MSLVDAVLVSRAREQLASGAWRRRDKDEPIRVITGCAICDRPGIPRNARICRPCYDAGWRAVPCPDCGEWMHKRDLTSPLKRCGKCRRAA
jgi:hypothetical protein